MRVGGNIGEPVTALLEGASDETLYVLEVSSFQLEGTRAFRPRLAVFLNLSADHLDRHASYAEYASAKARIFRNQGPEDWAVVKGDDPGVVALARAGRARVVPFHAGAGAPQLDRADLKRAVAGHDSPAWPVAPTWVELSQAITN